MAQEVFKRYEKKYLMSAEKERDFLKRIEGKMEMDKYGLHTICNIYFDTPDFDVIRTSIEKPVYKEKLRLRTYGVPKDGNHTAFVEIKKKFEKVVYKRRAVMSLKEAEDYLYRGIHPDLDTQIVREIDWFLKHTPVEPEVFLAYDRRAFAGVTEPEFRLTLDRNIRCRREGLSLLQGDAGEKIIGDDEVLMEIKIPGAMPLWMSEILSELEIFPKTFSKYGTYYMSKPENYLTVTKNHSLQS